MLRSNRHLKPPRKITFEGIFVEKSRHDRVRDWNIKNRWIKKRIGRRILTPPVWSLRHRMDGDNIECILIKVNLFNALHIYTCPFCPKIFFIFMGVLYSQGFGMITWLNLCIQFRLKCMHKFSSGTIQASPEPQQNSQCWLLYQVEFMTWSADKIPNWHYGMGYWKFHMAVLG